ncbi:MAG: L,D-transpeptidase family protein [Planctomycetota bacterium]
MRGFVVAVVALGVGALGYYGLSRVLERRARGAAPREAASSKEAGTEGRVAAPRAAPPGGAAEEPASPRPKVRPVFSSGSGEDETREAPPPAPRFAASLEAPRAAGEEPGPPKPAGSAVVPAVAPGLEGDRRLAWAAFESGDRERGLRLFKQMYAVWRDSPGSDLSRETLALLEAASEIDEKLEYAGYIARREGAARIFEDRLAECRRKLAVAEESPEAARAAWDELTAAYLVAGDRTRKKQVRALLDPFIERMVFSGRFTPVVSSYTVKPGDTLSGIAAKFRTTAASIERLNKLAGDTLHPRQRLRILPGELRIFVDKRDFVLWTTIDARVFLEFSVGLGKDDSTPEGMFVIEERQKDPTWFRPGQPPLPPGSPENVLGTRWLGFKDTPEYSGYGIHGTADPRDVGTESSAGCIRLLKDDVELLFDFAGRGTRVLVRR